MTKEKADVTVIGSGSWATAIVKLLSSNTEKIGWYIREKEIIDSIGKHNHNPTYLSAVNFDTDKLILTRNINRAVLLSDILIFVVPSAFLKTTIKKLNVDISGKIVCTAIKGIVPEDNMIVGEFLNKKYNVPYENLVVLTGPTHAEEIAMEKLSYLTIAALRKEKAEKLASIMGNFYLKTIVSDDIFGTEYAAVLKNIYAIAAGICHGLGYGDNFLAVLLANSATEMNRFIDVVYTNNRDITSSAYLGDLLVTGYSQFSRNRMFGNMIGKGSSVRYARAEMIMVAEGYYASECIYRINETLKVDMPIADTVYRILYEKANPAREVEKMTEILK
ncbi:MAG TPA: NAD(P)H-dependent glycerol-3-phosphate dehydrogenase [Bacteroidales bacterium]|nr:NAD(P)H-dependent glycerol-3-phosphate dehydrogenase [Bacteroidales bacterium]